MRGKTLLALILTLTMVAGLAACGKENAPNQPAVPDTTVETQNNAEDNNGTDVDAGTTTDMTVGNALAAQFKTEIAGNQDLEAVARALISDEKLVPVAADVMPVSEGFLNGFDAEIHGFSQGVTFMPMIGSIPFVGYIFETDDPDALVQSLKEHAQLNWNICTIADEMVVEQEGNYVFFVMAPNSFDD